MHVRVRLARISLLFLIVAAFALDIVHGVALRQHETLFSPIYRLRQSLGIALSRLHERPAGGYVAHRSVINALNVHGFGIFPEDARHGIGWEELLGDRVALNDAIREAQRTPIDTSLSPEILRGNELGYADFVYASFSLFGLDVRSLHLFLFLLIGASSACYVLEFHRSAPMLFLLLLYLAGLYWLQTYAKVDGIGLYTTTNSRLFSAFSLLPATHILITVWRQQPMRLVGAGAVIVQCTILVFFLSCRDEIMWQVLMIVVVTGALALVAVVQSWRSGSRTLVVLALRRYWPGVLVALLVLANSLQKDAMAGVAYAEETKRHLFWHTVLAGLLIYSPELQSIFLDREEENADTMVRRAITQDLNRRNDTRSPIATVHNGRIEIDWTKSQTQYERLGRALTLHILMQHPQAVLRGTLAKLGRQTSTLFYDPAIGLRDLIAPFLIALLGGIACAGGGGFSYSRSATLRGAGAMAIVLMFALMTPLIFPAKQAAGTAIAYLVATGFGVAFGMDALRRRLLGRPA